MLRPEHSPTAPSNCTTLNHEHEAGRYAEFEMHPPGQPLALSKKDDDKGLGYLKKGWHLAPLERPSRKVIIVANDKARALLGVE